MKNIISYPTPFSLFYNSNIKKKDFTRRKNEREYIKNNFTLQELLNYSNENTKVHIYKEIINKEIIFWTEMKKYRKILRFCLKLKLPDDIITHICYTYFPLKLK